MIQRLLGLSAATALLLASALPARADIVVTRDGKFIPAKAGEGLKPGDYPSDEALQASGKGNLDLRYDTVKVGRDSVRAGFVLHIYSTNAARNQTFVDAENRAASGFWEPAAQSFAAAAQDLEGADRQIALWNRITCLRNTGDVNATQSAVNEFLTAFPEGYYAPQAYLLLARIAAVGGRAAEAKAELAKVSALKGVNPRDQYEALVSEADWFLLPVARTAATQATAEKAYRDIVAAIKGKNVGAEAAIPLMKAQVGIGKVLLAQGKTKDAVPFFEEVVANPESLTDRELLAGAYVGLGDAAFKEVDAKKASVTKDKIPAMIQELDGALLHYLRVAHHYKDDAGDSQQPAWLNAARVLEWQADLLGTRDEAAFELLDRSSKMYRQAHSLLPTGEPKRLLTAHIRGLYERRDALRAELDAAKAGAKPN